MIKDLGTRMAEAEANIRSMDGHLTRALDSVEKLDVVVAAMERILTSAQRDALQAEVGRIAEERADRQEMEVLNGLRQAAEIRGLVPTTKIGESSFVMVRFVHPQTKARTCMVVDGAKPDGAKLRGHGPDDVVDNHRVLVVYDPK